MNQTEFLRRHAESIIEAYVEGKYNHQLTLSDLQDDVNLGLTVSDVASILQGIIQKMVRKLKINP